ncbi:MAG: DUF5711 family protein [Defluviitaleaceae bacterium]|nr:DUF5711 family protein [Defluviitaleaceae bacterium]
MNGVNLPNKKKRTSPVKIVLVVAALLISAALIQQVILGMLSAEARQELHMAATGVSVSYGFDMHQGFHSPNTRHFFFSTREGVQIKTSAGDLLQEYSFNLRHPVMIGRGSTVAIGEPDGHKIYVFNTEGLWYYVNFEHPTILYNVNQAGHLSVITRTNVGYELQVFNPNNPQSYVFRNPINDANVFPTAIDVSECGTYIALALLDVDTLIYSQITFNYIRRADSRALGLTDGLIRGYIYNNEFIYRIQFTNCGRVLVFTDQQILGFATGPETQGALWSIPLYNQPDILYIGENNFAYVTGDPFLNHPEAKEPGVLHIYNFYGQLTGTYDLGGRATHLSIGFNTILVGTGRTFYAITAHGLQLWQYSALQDVANMIFMDNTDTVLMAGGASAVVMQLVSK